MHRASRADFSALQDYFDYTIKMFGGADNQVFQDPKHLNDKEFFGKWCKNVQIIQPLLDYSFADNNSGRGLYDIETFAKAGDYETAKSKLLDYFRRVFKFRSKDLDIEVDERTKLTAQALFANFVRIQGTGDVSPLRHVAAIWSVNQNNNNFTADVTEDINQALKQTVPGVVYTLTTLNRGKIPAIFQKDAYISANVNGNHKCWPLAGAVAVSAGDNKDTNFAGKPLLANESVISAYSEARADANTWRTYLYFDFSGLSFNSIIEDAILHICGRLDTPKSLNRDVVLWRDQSLCIDENTLTWRTVPQHFQFSWDLVNAPDFTRPPADESPTLLSWTDNMAKYTYMFGAAKIFKACVEAGRQEEAEAYAYHAIRLIMAAIHLIGPSQVRPDLSGGHNAGQRALAWPKLISQLIDSKYMTPTVFAAIMKNIYMINKDLIGPGWDLSAESNNHGLLRAQGLFVNSLCWPQFFAATRPLSAISNGYVNPDSGWVATAVFRMAHKINKDTFADGSSAAESSVGYACLSLSTVLFCVEHAKLHSMGCMELFSGPEWDITAKAANYIMDMSNPTWGDWKIGNGYHHDTDYRKMATLDGLGEQIKWWHTDGRKGVLPKYTSACYFQGRHAVLRSGWMRSPDTPAERGGCLPDDIVAMSIVADGRQRSHSHHDDTSLTLFGYGQHLLIDPGNFWDEDYKAWFESPLAHNMVTIDNQTAENTGHNWGSMNPDMTQLNQLYDYLRISTPNTPGMAEHYRDVLFIRPEYVIVTDFLRPADGRQTNTFSQTWHTMPHAAMTIDHNTNTAMIMNPAFSDAKPVSLAIVQANPTHSDISVVVRSDGWFVPGANVRVPSEFLQFNQEKSGAVSYNTILFPFKEGEDVSVCASRIPIDGLTEAEVSAFKIIINRNGHIRHGHFFSLHSMSKHGAHSLNPYATDAGLVFIEKDYPEDKLGDRYNIAILQDGSFLRDEAANRDLIRSALPIRHIGIEWRGDDIHLFGQMPNPGETPGHLVPMMSESDLNALHLQIYGHSKSGRVYLNGKRVCNVRIIK